jgi:hypothetical protein
VLEQLRLLHHVVCMCFSTLQWCWCLARRKSSRAEAIVVSTTNQLRTQLASLQSLHHKTTSELSVLQTRIEVSTSTHVPSSR